MTSVFRNCSTKWSEESDHLGLQITLIFLELFHRKVWKIRPFGAEIDSVFLELFHWNVWKFRPFKPEIDFAFSVSTERSESSDHLGLINKLTFVKLNGPAPGKTSNRRILIAALYSHYKGDFSSHFLNKVSSIHTTSKVVHRINNQNSKTLPCFTTWLSLHLCKLSHMLYLPAVIPERKPLKRLTFLFLRSKSA